MVWKGFPAFPAHLRTTKDTDWETTGMGMRGGGFRGLQFSQPPVHSWPFLPPLPASSSLSDYVLRVRSENTAVFSQRPLVILGEGTRLSACSVPTPYCFLISCQLLSLTYSSPSPHLSQYPSASWEKLNFVSLSKCLLASLTPDAANNTGPWHLSTLLPRCPSSNSNKL